MQFSCKLTGGISTAGLVCDITGTIVSLETPPNIGIRTKQGFSLRLLAMIVLALQQATIGIPIIFL